MKRVIIIYLLFLSCLTAEAQVEKIIVPSDLKQQTIVTEPVTMRKGYFRAGVALSYYALDKYFTSATKKEYFPLSSWHTDFTFQATLRYGITDRLEVDIAIPVSSKRTQTHYEVKMPEYNTDYSYSADSKGKGIADCDLTVKYQVIPEKEKKFSLSVWQWITFPTGNKNYTGNKSLTEFKSPTGNGSFTSGIEVSARKISYPYSFGGYVSYAYKFQGSKLMSPVDSSETKFKDGNYTTVGASFNLHLNEWIVLSNEFNYKYNEKGVIKYKVEETVDPAWEFCYQPGLYFQVRRFRISEVVQVPLMGKNNSADPLYLMQVQYTF
jgi:hypothetical protein